MLILINKLLTCRPELTANDRLHFCALFEMISNFRKVVKNVGVKSVGVPL